MWQYHSALSGVAALAFLASASPGVAQPAVPPGVDPSIFIDTDEPAYALPADTNAPTDVFRSFSKSKMKRFEASAEDAAAVSKALERINVDVNQPSHPDRYGLGIYIFEVGQSDSMLIVGPAPERRAMLVDLGLPREGQMTGDATLRHVAQRVADILGRTHIEYFMISHFHSDHYGIRTDGFLGLLDRVDPAFTVGMLIDTGDVNDDFVERSKTTRDFTKVANRWKREEKLSDRVRPTFGTDLIDLGGGVEVDILAFAGKLFASDKGAHRRYEEEVEERFADKPASENDLSIAFELSLGDFEFWSAGDLSGDDGVGTPLLSGAKDGYVNIERPMLERWLSLARESDVEIYRANHHGSKYSSSVEFLEALDPEFVLYSAEKGHKHPNPETVLRSYERARQIATDIDLGQWKSLSNFEKMNGEIAGEIQIFVSPSGAEYEVNGKHFRSYTDEEEADEADLYQEI